jgi:ABC-2 type transport system ATP-binding protein
MFLGLVSPTGGEAFVLGRPSGEVEIRRKVGFLPEDFRFYQWLTATELLEFHGRLWGMDGIQLHKRVPYVLDLVGLSSHRGKRLQGFSKGMVQRIGLAQALIHDPEVIFLDEPTSGLDPMGRRLVRDIIRAQRDRGATVFLNSHLLSEIEITCDEVAFIRDGEIVATRNLHHWQDEKVRVTVRARKLAPQTIAGLSQWAVCDRVDGESLALTATSHDALPEILSYLVQSGSMVSEFTPHRISLEDLFMEIVGEDRGL